MEFIAMPAPAARLAAFEAGAVDYADFFVTNAEEALAFHERFPDVQIHLTPVFSALYSLALNLDLPQFADVRVRRALSLAIDREAMARELYQGLAKTLPTIPWTYLFDAEPATAGLGPWFRPDLGEAKRLLAAAGRSGLSFEMLYYNYDDTQNRRANEMIAADLARIGVNVRLRHVEVAEFNQLWSHGRIPEAADGWAPIGYAADTYFKDHLRTGSATNRWHIADPEVDAWAAEQSTELDPQRRRELQRRIWDRMLDRVYRIEKIANMKIYAYQEWLRNFRSGGALNSIGRGDHGAYVANVWIDAARAGRRQPEAGGAGRNA
jgi:ABC-type transport system substrate-binding protein